MSAAARTPASIFYPPEMPAMRPLGRFRFRGVEKWPFSIVFADGSSESHIVPAGFICDLYSSPLIAQRIVPKSQRSEIPALIHDYAFATGGFRATAADEPALSLAQCNRLLAIAMEQEKFSFLERTLIYRPVQLGSGFAWRRCLDRAASLATPILD